MIPTILITGATFGFFLFLIPAVISAFNGRTSITLSTSLPYMLFVSSAGVALMMLNQYIAGVINLMAVPMWGFIALMRILDEQTT